MRAIPRHVRRHLQRPRRRRKRDVDGLPYTDIERTRDGIEYVAGGIAV